MAPLVVLFEDHTAVNFRPLAWSLPVYELRCGLLALRERVARLIPDDAADPRLGLLPRGLLAGLQALCAPDGAAVGADACGRVARERGALLLSARLGPDEAALAALFAQARAGEWSWSDDEGLLACSLGPREAVAWLEEWAAWEAGAAAAGAWTRDGKRPAPLRPAAAARVPARAGTAGPWSALRRLWDIVPALGPALTADAATLAAGAALPGRRLFGVVPEPGAWESAPPWEAPTRFAPLGGDAAAGVHVTGTVWAGPGVRLAPGTVVDAGPGPVVLDRDARVQPHCFLQGPLYIGPGALVKAGARIYGETSLGAVCRVAGEIGESLFLDFANKQHDGFIGHALLGSWVNLGAGTTCSDLKNNYGQVRVDCGLGAEDTGLRFLGLMMADHAKSAIGTLFNTGTAVGFASNVFGAGFPPKTLPNYTWGDPDGPPYDAHRAAEVARVVMGRRGCRFLPEHERLFLALARDV